MSILGSIDQLIMWFLNLFFSDNLEKNLFKCYHVFYFSSSHAAIQFLSTNLTAIEVASGMNNTGSSVLQVHVLTQMWLLSLVETTHETDSNIW